MAGMATGASAGCWNSKAESFNGKLRDECLNMEIFYTLTEAKVLIEQWRNFYNTERPHSSLGYRPPAPQAILPPAARLAALSILARAVSGGRLVPKNRQSVLRPSGERWP